MSSANHSSNVSGAVVIGGGIAGTTCAVELRQYLTHSGVAVGNECPVTLINPSSMLTVGTSASRLSRTLEWVSISEISASEWSSEATIKYVKGRATFLTEREITLSDGHRIPFRVCCIATGASPFLPAALSDKRFTSCVHCIRDVDSVEQMQRKLQNVRRVLVLGNGGIAMELVHEIKGCDVIWVMKSKHIGNPFFDEHAGECIYNLVKRQRSDDVDNVRNVVQNPQDHSGKINLPVKVANQYSDMSNISGAGVGPNWLGPREGAAVFDRYGNKHAPNRRTTALTGVQGNRSSQLRIHSNSQVSSLCESKTHKVRVILTNGTAEDVDMIIAATGVVPNVSWLKGTCIALDENSSYEESSRGGVLVRSETLETNIKGIVAAGDCATVTGTEHNWFQMRLWTQARSAGRAAAITLAQHICGGHVATLGLEYELFAHVTRFFGLRVVLLGRYAAQGLPNGFRVVEGGGSSSDDYFIRVVLQDGKMKGALVVGDVDVAETYENLILAGLHVEDYARELVDPNADIEDYFD